MIGDSPWRHAGRTACLLLAGLIFSPEAGAVIPAPALAQMHGGEVLLGRDTPTSCADPADTGCTAALGYFKGLLPASPGGTTPVEFHRTPGLKPEAYRLHIEASKIEVSAGSDAGFFYGAMTLWQMTSADGHIAEGDVFDGPRFSWRGVLLDSARHFQKPDDIKRFIDAMALHKLNVLQWHLTDDQGWRIEIKKYPLLTEVGAFRENSREGRYGGFYTQAEIREIVAYAAARHITIVPEIEMPGHATAAIAAYPQIGSTKKPVQVSGDWGVFPNLFNVNDTTFSFIEDVLTEVMALFPSPYIHVGGDEAPKTQWNASPSVKARLKALGVKDSKALQGYFTARIGKFLETHGRHLIGWDEILEGDVPASAAVMSWRSVASADEAAVKGHDVVLAPDPYVYLDYCQLARRGEPTCRGIETSLEQVYKFDPVPKGALAQHLLGMQANIWTEHLTTSDALFYAAFPRLAAFAEIAWAPAEKHDWQGFLTRLPAMMERYRALGIVHSEAAFSIDATATKAAGGAKVTLANQTKFGDIHYTTDGSAPDIHSPVYDAPLALNLPATVTATAFFDGRPLAEPREKRTTAQSLLARDSYTLEQCTNDFPLAQKGHTGAVVMVNVINPCWIYRGLDLTGIKGFDLAVTHLPANALMGEDLKHIRLRPKAAPHGQLEIHLGSCKGKRIAVAPLGPDTARLHAAITARRGVHDLCIVFARRTIDPIWAIDTVQPVAD